MTPDRDRIADASDLAACCAALRGGSRTFFAASLLLPRGVRDPAAALYAFCRLADDAIDQGGGDAALRHLRDRLARAYQGRPYPAAADRALAHVVTAYGMPRGLLDALLEGFAWDAQGRRYEDLAALHAYAARVAGAVGAMMAVLMGTRAPEMVARACDLGVAMQLSNIARDVGEDARAGRLYLPLQWLREAGIAPDAWLVRPVFTPELGGVVARLLREADALYVRAGGGISRLPLGCRPGIGAARFLYAEIGREVERRGLDSVTQRAVVSPARKMAALVRTLVAVAAPPRVLAAPPLEATRFLVDAVAAQAAWSAPARPDAQPTWWNIDDRAAWLCELFAQLDARRAHMAHPGAEGTT